MKEDTLSDTAGIADSCLFLAGYLLPESNLNCLCLLPITDLILFSYFVIASWIFFIPIFLTWIWQVNCVLNFLVFVFEMILIGFSDPGEWITQTQWLGKQSVLFFLVSWPPHHLPFDKKMDLSSADGSFLLSWSGVRWSRNESLCASRVVLGFLSIYSIN